MYPPAPYKARKKRHSGPSLPRSPFAALGFGRGRRARLGRKDVALTLLGVLLVYFVYTSWGPGSRREPESVRLERHMNDEASVRRVWDVTSSFDWAAIKFKYPPPSNPAPLPTGPVGKGKGDKGSKGSAAASLPRVQHLFPPETAAAAAVREARRDEVRAVFQKSWRSYRRFAWMQDALLPVSGGGRDQFSGWSATLVDALDTLWIMGMREEFDEAVDAVARSKQAPGHGFGLFKGDQMMHPAMAMRPLTTCHEASVWLKAFETGHRQIVPYSPLLGRSIFLSVAVANPRPQSTSGSPQTRGSTCSRPTSATSAA